jgi:hypothetical protein
MTAGKLPDPAAALPIACSLNATDLAARERRWAELLQTAGMARRATTDGVELRFRADQPVDDELRELVAGERECCAWARWELDRDDDALVLHAHATGHGAATLQSMFLADLTP